MTSAELTAAGNSACRTFHRSVLALAEPSDFATSAPAAAGFLDKVSPLIHAQYTSLASLIPPAGERAVYRQFLTGAAHQLALVEDARSSAHAGSQAYLGDLEQAAVFKQDALLPLVHQLGLSACQT